MQPPLPEKKIQDDKTSPTQSEAVRVLESILRSSGLAIITTTPEGLITGFNQAAENLLGYSADEVIGKSVPMIFHVMDEVVGYTEQNEKASGTPSEPAFEVMIPKAWSEKTGDAGQWTFIRKEGSQFHGSLKVTALHNCEGQLTGFAAIIADISLQHSLKEQIALSEKKFRLLAENIQGAIYLCNNDETCSVIYINDYIQTITGYAKEDFFSGIVSFGALFHPEDKKMIGETINRSVYERKSYQLHYRIKHASGEWRWVEDTGVCVYEGDRLTMLEGFLLDITVQKKVEDKLQKVSEENLLFFNNPVNLNAVADFHGTLQRISPSWTKMLGWSDHELKSQPVLDFVHPDDLQTTREELKYIEDTRKVRTFENRLSCKDGSYRWLLWALASDPHAKMIYASAIDISARKKSEEHILDSKSNLEGLTLQLQEQNRRLDEFAHIISHNLRAPVNNIQALINLLDEKSEINDYQLIYEKIKNVAKNLGETMNELMDALKAQAQQDVQLTEIRFKEVLDKVVQSLEGELIVAQASVTFDFNEAPNIHYSKPYLESIFQNLLTNAIKYKSPRRKPLIHFKSAAIGEQVQLQVTDNGQGIDMERFGDKLFGLHKTFHNHQEARGVGLFLVKTQIEALGGSIAATSEVDKGTTFTIRFA